ncbi:MAG: V-type ATP synthase subunit I [Spirochaetaceae bacterium]|jgi:V/A-type H+-transporting ATPase subunit I|nr:V-type ATP synthase subunit I [Spirochaetaceae bacterium]
MIRPVKMKRVRITVLDKDIIPVLKYLGSRGIIQFTLPEKPGRGGIKAAQAPEIADAAEDAEKLKETEKALEKLTRAAAFLEIELAGAAAKNDDTACELPGEEEARSLTFIAGSAERLERELYNINLERQALEDQIRGQFTEEMKKLGGLYPDLNTLVAAQSTGGDSDSAASFLNIRLGHIDGTKRAGLENALHGRAVIVALNGENNGGGAETVLVASSKIGRFAMDSSFEDAGFEQLPVNKLSNEKTTVEISTRLAEIADELMALEEERQKLRKLYEMPVRLLYGAYLMAQAVLQLKKRLSQTRNTYELSGWVESPLVSTLVKDLDRETEGRVSVLSYDSWEVPAVREGREKVPVKLRHGKLVKSFEPLVLSYGTPLYGTIDPTAFTAVLFSLLFGVMFGDVGQGGALILLGIAAGKARMFANKRHFSGPLIIAGVCAAVAGLLYGSVFSNEALLEGPTKALTRFLSQTRWGGALGIHETGHILHLMPESGNIGKLFYFFGFTLSIGVIINSLGIILNIVNSVAARRWERAFFSKHGLAGGLFFWYAISLAIRAIVQQTAFRFLPADAICLGVPVLLIVTGPCIMSLLEHKKLFENGIFAFVMEGIVEIIETLSGYISNTVSFLRVGAFALSHAVLSFIIFTMADKVAHAPLGPLWSFVIIIFGNVIIIVLEGMIVAIQVVRLQYYEFFSKFFTETSSEFSPFRFKRPWLTGSGND